MTMTAYQILKNELGEKRMKQIEDLALRELIIWAMVQYHDDQVKLLNEVKTGEQNFCRCQIPNLRYEDGKMICKRCKLPIDQRLKF